MTRTFRFIMALFLFATSFESYSQISLTSYSIYAIGINSSQNKKINFELKTFANQRFEDLTMELDGFYNFPSGEYHRFSIGLGINLDPFTGDDHINLIVLPAALELFPLQDFRRLSVIFEFAPGLLPEDGLYFRSLWGIRYSFQKSQ